MFYGHGDDGYRFKADIIADFSTNVWYGGEPKGLKEHIFAHWYTINKYPEVLGESLSEKIADHHHHLLPDNILVNNGSAESIYLIAQAFSNKKAAIVIPTFSEYEDAARVYGHNIIYIAWDELKSTSSINADLIFICNPNNPNGDVFFHIEELLSTNPNTLFVIDEAFIEFTLSISSAIPLINSYPNLTVLRSLTKAYAIPGMRLGYIAACTALVAQIKRFKFPWSVNAIALETGKYIFDNYTNVQLPLKNLLKDKEDFRVALQQTPIKIYNSYTHFLLLETLHGKAAVLKQYLLNNYGLLIRDASNFRGLSDGHFRVATLTPDKNQLLVNALQEWNGHYS